MKKLIYLFIFFISSITFSFNISPDGFGKRFDNMGGFQEYTLNNNSGKTIRYRFKILPGDKDKSMHKFIKFQPKYMTIKSGESKKLKIFAQAPKNTPIGDYNFYLAVESVTIPGIINSKKGSVTTDATVGINVHIEMLGWVGDLPAKLKLKDYKVYEKDGKVRFKGNMVNYTKKRFVRYMMEIIGNSGERVTIYGGVLPANKNKNFDVPLSKFKRKNDIWKIEVRETLDRNLIETIKLWGEEIWKKLYYFL